MLSPPPFPVVTPSKSLFGFFDGSQRVLSFTIASSEHQQPAVHVKHQDLLGEPLLAGVAVTQLQGEVEQGWVLVQHPVLVEDYQHHLPECGGSILNLRRHDFRHLAHAFFLAKETKMLRFFKVEVELIDSQKWQTHLWIRETKTRMMKTFLDL